MTLATVVYAGEIPALLFVDYEKRYLGGKYLLFFQLLFIYLTVL